jgi:succinyl-diaminopimelate desuccinylase
LTGLNQKVEEILERCEKDVVHFCSRLVQANGENPPGDVSKVAAVVEAFLNEHGVSFQRYEPTKGHANIVATVGKGTPTIILCGHTDVVPAGDLKNWNFPPYNGRIEEGTIVGRGASDMKGGIAAMLTAATALKHVEKELNGTAVFAAVCDEEAMGPAGAIWMLKNHKLDGDICLITEPTGYLHSGYSIIAGERGNLWMRLTAKGKPAHGSTTAFGKNAILALACFINKIYAIEKTPVKTPKDARTLIKNGKIDMTKIAEKMGIKPQELTRTMDHYTVNLGTIEGGTKVNIVPERCEAEFDIRVPAGGNPDAVEEFVKLILPEDFEYEVINRTLASYTPADEPLIRILQTHAKSTLGYKPPALYMAATSDAHTFREMLKVPTIAFGPGYGEVNHAYNEFVHAKDVAVAMKIYTHTIIDYLCR